MQLKWIEGEGEAHGQSALSAFITRHTVLRVGREELARERGVGHAE